MKSLLAGLLIISSLQIANAASTDTVRGAISKVVELHIKLKDAVPSAKLKAYQRQLGFNKAGEGLCTGAFISSKGYILTARHCLEDAEAVNVTTYDLQHYTAKPVVISKTHDLAVLKIDTINAPYFLLSTSVEIGQTVYAIGNPLWIYNIVTRGVVAKLDGDVTWLDLTILPGNSGGPVIDEEGNLVGIATNYGIFGLGASHLSIMQSITAILGIMGFLE